MMTKTRTIQGTATTRIDAPIEAVWAQMAENFTDIGRWSSSVNRSTALDEATTGTPLGGRFCEIAATGFSDTHERILQFDENDTLRYQLYDGLPGFVVNAENTWTFRRDGDGTRLTGTTDMHVKGVMGLLGGPMMRFSTNKALAEMAREVKYFIEHGRPHPDKVKATAKFARKQPTAVSS